MFGKLQQTSDDILSFLARSRQAIGLIGPSGGAKTVLALEVAERYAKEHGVSRHYVELCPELTKSTLIGGETLVNGSAVIKKAVLLEKAERGAIIIVDEAAHTTAELLLQFNPLIDVPFMTDVGLEEPIFIHPKTRFLFAANPASTHSGNIKFPTSFSARIKWWAIGHPADIQEEIDITKQLAECKDTDADLIHYATSLARSIRHDTLPVSIRNIARLANDLQVFTPSNDVTQKRVKDALQVDLADALHSLKKHSPNAKSILARVITAGRVQWLNTISSQLMTIPDIEGVIDKEAIADKLTISAL